MTPETIGPSFSYIVPFHGRALTVGVTARGLNPPLFVLSCDEVSADGYALDAVLCTLNLPTRDVRVVSLGTRSIYPSRCRVEKGAAMLEDMDGWRVRQPREVILDPADPRLDTLRALFSAEKFLSDARNGSLDAYLFAVARFAVAAKDALPHLGIPVVE